MTLFALAQDPAPEPLPGLTADATSVIIERGADYRVVEWLQTVTDETSGETLTVTNRYHEIASGLHYLDAQGQYQETVAEFIPVPEGFVAARGPHQAALSSDIATPGSVTLVTPDGQTLTSNPTLLAYVDRPKRPTRGSEVFLRGTRSAGNRSLSRRL